MDFGLGWGRWALMAKAFGCNSYGLDLSQTRSAHAQSDGVVILDREGVRRHKFDFINADWVFEHIPDPFETLVLLRDALKTKGLISISVPTADDIRRRLSIMDWQAPKGASNSLNPVAPLEHINCFKRRTLVKMAATAHMKEVHLRLNKSFQLGKGMSTLRRIGKNVVVPLVPGLKRDNILLMRSGDDG